MGDGDIVAIMRKMDVDGDGLLSFTDFFAILLPYFIFFDPDSRPSIDDNQILLKNNKLDRAASAGAVRKRVLAKDQLYVDLNKSKVTLLDELESMNVTNPAKNMNSSPKNYLANPSKTQAAYKSQLKTLFSKNDPAMYFHKAPAANKILPNLN